MARKKKEKKTAEEKKVKRIQLTREQAARLYRNEELVVDRMKQELNKLNNTLRETMFVIKTLEGIKGKKDEEMLFPIGRNILLKGNLKDENNVLVNVSGIVLEKKTEDVIKDLEKEKSLLRDGIRKLSSDLNKHLDNISRLRTFLMQKPTLEKKKEK